MKTLYISDLDGALLNSKQQISAYTNRVIGKCIEQGMLFSYATARSYHSAKPVTVGLEARIPLILYNGSFVLDSQSQEVILSHFFTVQEVQNLMAFFEKHKFYPIVYSLFDKQDKFSYVPHLSEKEELDFVATRNDVRKHPIEHQDHLYDGDVFYISCISKKEILDPFYEQLKDRYQCLYSQDIYSHDWWLEILPQNVSKANAIQQLKKYLNCNQVIAFGDGKNDISMFEMADQCYAVDNACDELKAIATDVIGHHDEDAVAKWLEENFLK